MTDQLLAISSGDRQLHTCRGETDPTILRCDVPKLVKRCDEKDGLDRAGFSASIPDLCGDLHRGKEEANLLFGPTTQPQHGCTASHSINPSNSSENGQLLTDSKPVFEGKHFTTSARHLEQMLQEKLV